MQVVNGYVCQCCSDVSLAQQGVDPAHPEDDPKSPKYDPRAAQARNDPAVKFGGALASLNGVVSVAPAQAPQSTGATGRFLNLSA